jgi:hypothetical protein
MPIDNTKYQVFLFTCPATVPFIFACHPWFVVNKKGVVSRWEIFWQPSRSEQSWGHLHKDFYPPTQGIEMFFYADKYFFKSTLDGVIEGDEGSMAQKMAECIENSPHAYPYCNQYSLIGSNSNTYVTWILNQFPNSGFKLSWRAFGKNFVKP